MEGQYNLEEQKNIKNGTVAAGMRKDAVLAAYGYPPSHMTPSLEADTWHYWKDRYRRMIVHFKGDKVLSIEE